MTSNVKRLPEIFQTKTEQQFFEGTLDQVLSKKDSSLIQGYLGRRNPGNYDPINDNYVQEIDKERTWHQLEATTFSKNADNTKTNILFYDELLNKIRFYGGNTLN